MKGRRDIKKKMDEVRLIKGRGPLRYGNVF